MRKIAALFALAALPAAVWAQDFGGVEHQGAYGVVHPIADARPHADLTPGAIDPRVTQDNIHETICVRGYTRTVRPQGQCPARS